jgi:derlin-1
MRKRQSSPSLSTIVTCFTFILVSFSTVCIEARSTQPHQTHGFSSISHNKLPVAFNVLDVRGGALPKKNKPQTGSIHAKTATGKTKVQAAKQAQKKTSALGGGIQKYKKILPMTRLYITLVGLVSALGLILGDELAQGYLALDPMRVTHGLELWRPFTAASFLGPVSISWLMNAYFLFEYGSTLERAYGSAQQLVYLLSQVVMLSFFSVLTGQPFFAQSMITSMLHVLSRATPHQKVKWIVFTVPYWSLPYALMVADVLQAQGNPMAALPHILGILSGHIYYFYKFVWHKVSGGEDWLQAPEWLKRRMDPDAKSKQDAVNKALKAAVKRKGRKLGG